MLEKRRCASIKLPLWLAVVNFHHSSFESVILARLKNRYSQLSIDNWILNLVRHRATIDFRRFFVLTYLFVFIFQGIDIIGIYSCDHFGCFAYAAGFIKVLLRHFILCCQCFQRFTGVYHDYRQNRREHYCGLRFWATPTTDIAGLFTAMIALMTIWLDQIVYMDNVRHSSFSDQRIASWKDRRTTILSRYVDICEDNCLAFTVGIVEPFERPVFCYRGEVATPMIFVSSKRCDHWRLLMETMLIISSKEYTVRIVLFTPLEVSRYWLQHCHI